MKALCIGGSYDGVWVEVPDGLKVLQMKKRGQQVAESEIYRIERWGTQTNMKRVFILDGISTDAAVDLLLDGYRP